ncbi:MAG: transcriptional activator NhaR [Phycisphaerales bacterium]
MDKLNYHHLQYFWAVAKHGGVAEACERLHVAQPTISGQLRQLEASLDRKLFERIGRRLELTDAGREVFRYADEIFSIGAELSESLRGKTGVRAMVLNVGVADVLPKLVVHRLLLPALGTPESIRLVCAEGKSTDLIGRLAVHELDVVLTDAPLPPSVSVRAYSHELGRSGVTLFAAPALAARLARGVPESLDGAPFLLPMEGSLSRRLLDQWFAEHGVAPRVVAECADSALLKVFGQEGKGVFAAPTVIEREVIAQYGVKRVARLDGVHENFFAISIERRVRHPGVQLITSSARERLFSPAAAGKKSRP